MKKTILLSAIAAVCFAACRKDLSQNATTPVTSHQTVSKSQLTGLNEFKVMSFNLRNTDPADEFTQQQRKSYCLQVILDNDVDIVGVQELAEDSVETWFNTQMAAAGYGVYKGGHGNGSPKTIWFKNSRFTLANAGWFLMTLTEIRSGKWVILQDKQVPGNSYFVVNSHWTTVSSAERVMDADTVLNAIKTNNTQNLPVICFGDFNGEPGTPEITTIKDSDGLNMEDALFDSQGDLTYHRWQATGVKKIDYIFSTRNMAVLNSAVITTSFTVNGATLWPSDHWPVVATYVPAVFGGAHTDAAGASASTATDFFFADINGDGKKDKIYWNPTYDSGKPRVFLSNGDGTFAAAVTHAAGASTSPTTRYYFADIDGDGKADEIQWDPTLHSGHTQVFLATSGGNFSATAIDNPEGTSQGTTTIYNFADVNGDGKADKIYWNATFDNGHTRVYLATSGGSFSGTVVSGADGASTTAGTSFYYADVNGDGKADEINWHPTVNSGLPNVYLSDGDGTFTASSTFTNSGASSASSATQFSFADVNGDGRADKIYWNPGNYLGEPKVYYAQSNNTFNGPIYSLRGTSQSANTIFYYTDINGDGKVDQVRWNYAENNGELRNYFSN